MCNLYNSMTRGPNVLDLVAWARPELSGVQAAMFPRYRGAVLRVRDGEVGMDVMTWTRVPYWAKQLDCKKFRFNNNARA